MYDVLQCGRFLGLSFICAHDVDQKQNKKKGTFSKNDLTERNSKYNSNSQRKLVSVNNMWYLQIKCIMYKGIFAQF